MPKSKNLFYYITLFYHKIVNSLTLLYTALKYRKSTNIRRIEMKLIDKQVHIYSPEEKKIWANEAFVPQVDIRLSLQLEDGNIISGALFNMKRKGQEENHYCISTQAGCKFGCKFCASGKNGWNRNLTAEEMAKQVELLSEVGGHCSVDHISLMGIGEPLDNMEDSLAFIELADKTYPGCEIALANSGIPNKITALANQVNRPIIFWLSLHSAIEAKRQQIMPIANKYKIAEIIEASRYLANKNSQNHVSVNYMLFKGFNDTLEDAVALVELLRGTEKELTLKLTMPNNSWNIYEPAEYQDIVSFQRTLRVEGLKNPISRLLTAGKKLGAGCGEFVFVPN